MRSRGRSGQAAARDVLSQLLTAAFVDIRATSHSGAHLVEVQGLTDRDRINLLTNMFHNVPGQMNNAASGDGDYQSVLDRLWTANRTRNDRAGPDWLDGAVAYLGIDRGSPLFASWLPTEQR
jgi:hypothetical protein